MEVVSAGTATQVMGEKKDRRHPVASPRLTPNNPMERTLSDLVGSAVVFDLQQLIETYLPVVGT